MTTDVTRARREYEQALADRAANTDAPIAAPKITLGEAKAAGKTFAQAKAAKETWGQRLKGDK
jgi:hypothetical protein